MVPALAILVPLIFFGREAYRTHLRSALLEAVGRGDLPATRALLNRGADPEAMDRDPNSTWYHYTPLLRAIREDRGDLVDLLLEKGANPNAPALEGETALISAIRGNHVDATRALIDHGADVNKPEAGDWRLTPAWAAMSLNGERHRVVYDLLKSHGARISLAEAVVNDDETLVSKLLREGANANGADITGQPLLHRAVTRQQVSMVHLLIAPGADPNIPNGRGETPLYTAAIGVQSEPVVKVLVAGGADVNAQWQGKTLLWHVKESYRKRNMGNLEFYEVRLLKRFGAHE